MLLLLLTSALALRPHATLCFVRHGQSEWNSAGRFTGWTDVDLTDVGRQEAALGGQQLQRMGCVFDRAFTSELRRAQETLAIVLHSAAQHDVPTMRHWRLNERHYGALQGRAKQSCVAEYGIEQVRVWRNSFSTPPPLVSQHSPTFPGNDPRYAHIPPELLPRGECLKDTLARCLPLWNERIVPELRAGQSVLVVAHGHSIRALVKHLERVSDDAIADVSLPNAVPLLYHLGEHLQPLHVAETASGLQHEPAPGLRGVFLGDRSAVSSFDWMVAAEASDESSGPVPEAGRPSRSQPS